MSQVFRNRYLYMINLALLVTFQIASAYWQLWSLFQLPGGIDLYLIINLVFSIIAIWGLLLIVNHIRLGLYFSLFLAAAGLITSVSSLYHLFVDQVNFRPLSLIILVCIILVVSIIQGAKAAENLIRIFRRHHHHKDSKHTPVSTQRL